MAKKIDMTGWVMKEHGVPNSRLTVIEEDKTKRNGSVFWICQCECGNTISIKGIYLRNGHTLSCGCYRKNHGRFIDMSGWVMKQHGIPDSKLTVLELDREKSEIGKPRWKCLCDCGKTTTILGTQLRSGQVKSCGCSHLDFRNKLEGKKFNKLLVLEFTNIKDNSSGSFYYKCLCDCGNITYATNNQLTTGAKKSCGCLKQELLKKIQQDRVINLTGKTFGKLTVLNQDKKEPKSGHGVYWKCKCECGGVVSVSSYNLIHGLTKSCGCLCSSGEYKTIQLLITNNIPYETQKTYDDCLGNTGRQLRFDFFINNSFLLEIDGKQHYHYDNVGWNTEENFYKTKERDNIKNEYCFKNNIPLKRIPWTEWKTMTIEDIMGDKYLVHPLNN